MSDDAAATSAYATGCEHRDETFDGVEWVCGLRLNHLTPHRMVPIKPRPSAPQEFHSLRCRNGLAPCGERCGTTQGAPQ